MTSLPTILTLASMIGLLCCLVCFWVGFFVGCRDKDERYHSYRLEVYGQFLGWHNQAAQKLDKTTQRVAGLEDAFARLNLPNQYWAGGVQPKRTESGQLILEPGSQFGGKPS